MTEYTNKNKKSSLGNDAIYLTASRIIVTLISVITSMLLARFRTLGEYGTYSQIIMVTDLVSTILLLGLPNSINYFLAKADTEEEKKKFMSVYITLSTILTFIIAVCLICALPIIISYFKNPAIKIFAYVFLIYPWSSIIINSLGNTCIIYGNANKLIIFNIIHSVINLFILLLAKFYNLNFQQYMIMYMAAFLFFALYALGWIKKMVGAIKFFLSKKLIIDIFKFSIPLGLASVVGTLNVELDKLVIGHFFSTEEYAVFTNAARELPVTFFSGALTAVLLPKFVKLIKEKKITELIKIWGAAINLSLCVMCLLVGLFFVFAPELINIFYSKKYVTPNGVIVFQIYNLILLFRITYWGIILNASGKTKLIFYSSLLTLLLNFIGNIGLYYMFGFIGPAISTLIVTLFMNFFQLIFSCKTIKVSFFNLLPWKNIFLFIGELTIYIITFSLVKKYILINYNHNILSLFFLIFTWIILYSLSKINFLKHNWLILNSNIKKNENK